MDYRNRRLPGLAAVWERQSIAARVQWWREHTVWERPVSSARRRDLDTSCRRRHDAAFSVFQHLRTGWLPALVGNADGGGGRGVQGDPELR